MSLAALCSVHTLTLQRASVTAGDSLGHTEAWTAISTLNGRIQPMKASEVAMFSRLGIKRDHVVYFASDPGISGGDGARYRFVFGSRYFEDLAVRNFDELGRLWRVDCVETTHDANA